MIASKLGMVLVWLHVYHQWPEKECHKYGWVERKDVRVLGLIGQLGESKC